MMALLRTRSIRRLGRSANCFLASQSSYWGETAFPKAFSDQNSDDSNGNTKKKSSSSMAARRSSESEISSSRTLIQYGLSIQELPILVKRTVDIPGWTDIIDAKDTTVDVDPQSTENEELNKVIQLHLRHLNTTSEVMQYFLVIPTKDVTPLVALSILERIVELQNDNVDDGEVRKIPPMESSVISRLCNIICRSSNSNFILTGMESLVKLGSHFPEKEVYIQIFVKECLQRVHCTKLKLMQICWLIENLFNAGRSFENVSDSLWSEIVARKSEISLENINRVFALLLYLKSSRQVVLNMLEKEVYDLYPRLSQKQVVHMLHILCLLKLHSRKLLNVFTFWTTLNINQLTESGLRDTVMLMNSIPYTNNTIQKAIERFLKVQRHKRRDALLMTALAEKVHLFRWRSPVVLDSIASYFVENIKDLTPETWTSLIQVFGYLNYEPANSFELFKALENSFLDKIPDLDPDTVISVLLGCVYIQRYPLNFVKKLFSPVFLDRLNFEGSGNEGQRRTTYNKLKLLDTALHLECPTYPGPYLPRNLAAKSLYSGDRLNRIRGRISSHLTSLLGGPDLYQERVVLPKVPLNDLYVIDILIHLNKKGKPQPYRTAAGIHKKVAVLLLLPEHMCRCCVLIGPQAMRVRHLNLLGLEVVTLHVFQLEQLHQREIKEYLETKLSPVVCLDK